jgi:hypothetical protein
VLSQRRPCPRQQRFERLGAEIHRLGGFLAAQVIFLKVRLKWPGSAAPQSKKLSGNPAALLFSR